MNSFFSAATAGVAEILESDDDASRTNIALAMIRHSASPAQAMVRVLAMRIGQQSGRLSMAPLSRFGINESPRRELMEVLTVSHLDWYVAQFAQMTSARLFAEALVQDLSPEHPDGDRTLNRLCAGVLSLANAITPNVDLGEFFMAFISSNRRAVLEVFEQGVRTA